LDHEVARLDVLLVDARLTEAREVLGELRSEIREARKVLREIAAERKVLSPQELEEALDVRKLTEGGIVTLGGE